MNIIQFLLLLLFVFNFVERNESRRRYGGGSSGGRFTTSRPRITTRRGGIGHITTTRRSVTIHQTPNTHRSMTTHHTPTGGRFTTARHHSTTRSNIGWDLPPKPNTLLDHQQPTNVKIVNKYNYHYPGYVSLPVQSSYPGYYQPSTQYHYTSHDTGSGVLGFALGYGLAKLTTPTFTHQSFFDGYVPRYDHYTVHHYYHNKESVPPKQEIPANTIVACVGDSATVCPGNTTALCTTKGALMCVVSATSTVPCTDNRQVNCVKSVVSCVNNSAPECKNSNQNSTSISIPCVSNAKINGEIKYVNNTIVVNNGTATNTVNSTTTSTSTTEAVTVSNNGTATNTDNNTTTSTTEAVTVSTKYPITTTPTPASTTNASAKAENNTVQNFCVTVIALPAKREPTKGEILLNDAKDIVSNFISRVWGL